MALTITQQDNTIFLEGTLNNSTIKNFKTHFGFVLNAHAGVTLNIEKVTEIDNSSMITLKEIYRNAVLNNNLFFVAGPRSEEIYEDFQFMNIA
ncbi:hypothetical protein [Lacinutrix sp. 5H-3-7-4]|uniref:hypothetical protein n=1 Tax=Lacinutrix sp. (strain 5H-3-7-4) TaxID=983544 RepID=UPI00020A38C7|nr:hypothetical protein [Lacinutrix sp. 5H-3-7-4]AEH01192.1 hypothetical protein Lacal_1344 [Lacinutrix sp. 5H-3-7-4]